MALSFSSAFKNSVCTTSSLKGTFDGCFLRIYESASVPATADDALPADALLLCVYSTAGAGAGTGLTLNSLQPGVITKSTLTSWDGYGLNDGTATFFRFVRDTDTGTFDSAYIHPRIQGTIGSTNADMIVSNASIAAGQLYSMTEFSLSIFGG